MSKNHLYEEGRRMPPAIRCDFESWFGDSSPIFTDSKPPRCVTTIKHVIWKLSAKPRADRSCLRLCFSFPHFPIFPRTYTMRAGWLSKVFNLNCLNLSQTCWFDSSKIWINSKLVILIYYLPLESGKVTEARIIRGANLAPKSISTVAT